MLSNDVSLEEEMAGCPYCFHEPHYRFASAVSSPTTLQHGYGICIVRESSEKFLLRWSSHVTRTYVQNVKGEVPTWGHGGVTATNSESLCSGYVEGQLVYIGFQVKESDMDCACSM